MKKAFFLSIHLLNWEKSQFLWVARSLLVECVYNTDSDFLFTRTLRGFCEYPWELTGNFQWLSTKALALEGGSLFCRNFYTLNYYLMTWLDSHCPKLREWFTLATRHEQHVRQNRCHDRIVIAHKDLSKSSWAGSFKPILLFCGTTLDFIFVILSAKFATLLALPSPIDNSPPRLAKIPKKMNFHFQIFREKYNFPIITFLPVLTLGHIAQSKASGVATESVLDMCGNFRSSGNMCATNCVITRVKHGLGTFLFQLTIYLF